MGYICPGCGEGLPSDTPCPCSMNEDDSDVLAGRRGRGRPTLAYDEVDSDVLATRKGREVPTLAEIEAALAKLDLASAAKIRAMVHPAPPAPGPEPPGQPPPPIYSSWEDYLAKTTPAELRQRCASTASNANRWRLMSGRPKTKITAADVLAVLEAARGQCAHCESLAVERRPSKPNGAPAPWEHIGRRIGSLGHLVSRFEGGANSPANLVWSCLWCNTWRDERRKGATDRGGYRPLGT